MVCQTWRAISPGPFKVLSQTTAAIINLNKQHGQQRPTEHYTPQ